MNENILTIIVGALLGVFAYLFRLQGKLRDAEQEKARLETEKAQEKAVFDFRKSLEESKDAEENYKSIRDKYLNNDDDDGGGAA